MSLHVLGELLVRRPPDAVGHQTGGDVADLTIEHNDGTGWTFNETTFNCGSIWGSSDTNLWSDGGGFLMHYDGAAWTQLGTGTANGIYKLSGSGTSALSVDGSSSRGKNSRPRS